MGWRPRRQRDLAASPSLNPQPSTRQAAVVDPRVAADPTLEAGHALADGPDQLAEVDRELDVVVVDGLLDRLVGRVALGRVDLAGRLADHGHDLRVDLLVEVAEGRLADDDLVVRAGVLRPPYFLDREVEIAGLARLGVGARLEELQARVEADRAELV